MVACKLLVSPSPPVWPTSFSVSFNTTIYIFDNFGSLSWMYYDYGVPAERLEYDECPDGTNVPCILLFVSSNAYRITNNNSSCCLYAPVGPPNPKWTQTLQFNSTLKVFSVEANHFRGGDPQHNYYVDAKTNEPLMLLVEDIDELWVFTSKMKIGPQDKKLFVLPSSCNNVKSCDLK